MVRSFRAKPTGWRGESYRHYLARKGVSTGNKYFSRSLGIGKGNRVESAPLRRAWANSWSTEQVAADLERANKLFVKPGENPITLDMVRSKRVPTEDMTPPTVVSRPSESQIPTEPFVEPAPIAPAQPAVAVSAPVAAPVAQPVTNVAVETATELPQFYKSAAKTSLLDDEEYRSALPGVPPPVNTSFEGGPQ